MESYFVADADTGTPDQSSSTKDLPSQIQTQGERIKIVESQLEEMALKNLELQTQVKHFSEHIQALQSLVDQFIIDKDQVIAMQGDELSQTKLDLENQEQTSNARFDALETRIDSICDQKIDEAWEAALIDICKKRFDEALAVRLDEICNKRTFEGSGGHVSGEGSLESRVDKMCEEAIDKALQARADAKRAAEAALGKEYLNFSRGEQSRPATSSELDGGTSSPQKEGLHQEEPQEQEEAGWRQALSQPAASAPLRTPTIPPTPPLGNAATVPSLTSAPTAHRAIDDSNRGKQVDGCFSFEDKLLILKLTDGPLMQQKQPWKIIKKILTKKNPNYKNIAPKMFRQKCTRLVDSSKKRKAADLQIANVMKNRDSSPHPTPSAKRTKLACAACKKDKKECQPPYTYKSCLYNPNTQA